jgi:hypothetical protein
MDPDLEATITGGAAIKEIIDYTAKTASPGEGAYEYKWQEERAKKDPFGRFSRAEGRGEWKAFGHFSWAACRGEWKAIFC